MKLKVLIGAMALFLLGALSAQAQDLHLGLEAGGDSASFENSDASQIPASRLGLAGGAFAEVGFADFAIEADGIYIRKGGQSRDGSSSFQVDYIEVPVMAKFYLGVPELKPALLIGPYAAFNTLAQAQGGIITNATATDLGATIGVEMSLSSWKATARWEGSFTHVTTDTNIQNRDFLVMIGYSFI